MQTLPCGERFVRCLTGGDIDRVPFGVIRLGWSPWTQTRERWQIEAGRDALDVACEFEYDKSCVVPKFEGGPFPHFEDKVIETTDEFIVTRDSRGITLRNRKDGMSMPEFLDYPVKTPDDWARMKKERYDLSLVDARVSENWDAFRARLRETGEAVQVGNPFWGVFGTARDLLGAEELLVAFHTEPAMIKDIMTHLTTLWIALWERVASQAPIDHIHIWEDMSGRNGSLISPAMVEEFMMPCYDRIADFAQAHGVRLISVDTDGDCRELVPIMLKHGVNMFFPFEVQAGNDVRAYREKYPTLGIMGGLDKRALAGGTADVEREIERAKEMIALGRYIPMFDHSIPPDASWANFCQAAYGIKEACSHVFQPGP